MSICQNNDCKKEFKRKPGTKGRFCSYACYWKTLKGVTTKNDGQFKKGFIPANKGIFLKKAKYNTIHRWLQRNLVKLGYCQSCGKNGRTEWSNKDGLYSRNVNDYIELCASCHRFEDRKNPKNVDYKGGQLYG